MAFDEDNFDNDRNQAFARIQALKAASCFKILGKGVVKVVRRVDAAKENQSLGM